MKRIFFFLFSSLSLFLNSEESNRLPVSSLSKKFENILLVVHYNHPYYNSIEFIKEIYSPIFPNMVFYGEKKDPQVNVIPTHTGYYFSKVVSDVFKKYPQYEGYIFLQDDCFMNFWNFERLDTNKIWFHCTKTEQFHHHRLDKSQPACWVFDNTMLKELNRCFSKLTPEELSCFQQNHGEKDGIGHHCDMFYIPGNSFSHEQIIRLSDLFKNIFCEVAIPTILSCIDNLENWELIYKYSEANNNAVFSSYNPNLDWFHPLKFSNPDCKSFVRKTIGEFYHP